MKKISLFIIAISCGILAMAQPPQVPADKGANFGDKVDKVSADNAISSL